MDAETALVDQREELVDPGLATVIKLACRPGPKTACIDRKNQRAERGSVVPVERAVDEDVIG